MFVDTQRILADALPAFLADKPEVLLKLNTDIEKVKTETGVDLRSFETVAVGARYSAQSRSEFKAVVLARGHFDSGAVISAGLAAAKQTHEFRQQGQEEYKGKTLFIVGPSMFKARTAAPVRQPSGTKSESEAKLTSRAAAAAEVVDPPPPTRAEKNEPCGSSSPCGNSMPQIISQTNDGRVENQAAEKTVVTALDGNTLAAGDIESVKAAIDATAGGAHVNDELVQLATRNASALIGFSGNVPAAMTESFGHEQDEITKILKGIRQFYGSFSSSGTDMESALSLRMETPEQARGVKDLISTVKLMQGTGTGAGSDLALPSQGIIVGIPNIINKLNITNEGNDVQFQLKLTRADILPFLRGM